MTLKPRSKPLARASLAALLASLIAWTALPSDASAQEGSARRAWATPDSDAPGYEQVKSLAAVLGSGDKRIRLESSSSHTSRARMLREERVQIAATSVAGSYFAQEGLFGYAARDWGPQALRMVLANIHPQLLGIVAAGDASITSLADLKGKRITRVSGAPELQHHVAALLAFAGLTWADVTVVPVHGYAAAIEALIANKADAAFAASGTPPLQKLASSPRGLAWPVVPHADQAGWAALARTAPYFVAIDGTQGAGLSDKIPVEGVSWPYPVLVTLARRSSEEIYPTVSELHSRFRSYRDQVPGNAGWELKRQPRAWAIPWHEASVRLFREQGLWGEAQQAHNERLIRRQQVLRDAWESLHRTATAQEINEVAHDQLWLRARAKALGQAGFDPVVTPDAPGTEPSAGKP